MLYTIVTTITDTNGDEHTTTTTAKADTISDARKQADTTHGDGETVTVRVYPTTTGTNGETIADGVQAGALLVVRRTTANMVQREGGAIQWELYNAIRCNPVTHESALECVNVAALAIVEGINAGQPIAEQYHGAYLALNRYLHSIRSIHLTVTAMRTVYIADVDGDIVNVNKGIAEIVKTGAHYIPRADDDETDDETDENRADALRAIIAALAPVQRQVLQLMARGYSIHQIADTMNRNRKTIQEHVTAIRRKATGLFPNGVQ